MSTIDSKVISERFLYELVEQVNKMVNAFPYGRNYREIVLFSNFTSLLCSGSNFAVIWKNLDKQQKHVVYKILKGIYEVLRQKDESHYQNASLYCSKYFDEILKQLFSEKEILELQAFSAKYDQKGLNPLIKNLMLDSRNDFVNENYIKMLDSQNHHNVPTATYFVKDGNVAVVVQNGIDVYNEEYLLLTISIEHGSEVADMFEGLLKIPMSFLAKTEKVQPDFSSSGLVVCYKIKPAHNWGLVRSGLSLDIISTLNKYSVNVETYNINLKKVVKLV